MGVQLIAMLLLAVTLACLGSQSPALWTDPGRVEAIDFTIGAGGPSLAPQPPFQFVSEGKGGTSPKVIVRDAKGIQWRLKGGLEVRAETFVTRLVSALGYYAEPTYFLAKGKIEGVKRLTRASGFVQPDGTFTYASLERIDPQLKFTKDRWTWQQSPFKGSPQLNGLKIVAMLVSNWDNKDARDEYKGSNTSVIACGDQKIYFVNDWGQTLGRWGRGGLLGSTALSGKHSMWDCRGYTEQSAAFVRGTKDKYVQFGYEGQHTEDFKERLEVEDVRWLMTYLGRITDAQIRTGLLVSGASKEEEECFTKALRQRIEKLRELTLVK